MLLQMSKRLYTSDKGAPAKVGAPLLTSKSASTIVQVLSHMNKTASIKVEAPSFLDKTASTKVEAPSLSDKAFSQKSPFLELSHTTTTGLKFSILHYSAQNN